MDEKELTEIYYKLERAKPTETKPCDCCGLKRPPSGEDPCFGEMLPGVIQACCGHGVAPGYIMFENGAAIQGDFSIAPPETNRKGMIEHLKDVKDPARRKDMLETIAKLKPPLVFEKS